MISRKVNYGVLIVALALATLGFGLLTAVSILHWQAGEGPGFLIITAVGVATVVAFACKVKLWRHL